MKRKFFRSSNLYLAGAAVAQVLAGSVLVGALASRKKKNAVPALLSILALEGATTALLMAHMQKDIQALQLTDEMPVPEETITVKDADGNEVPAEQTDDEEK